MSLVNLQQKIGVTADGAFGPGTLKAAAAYYKLNKSRAAHFFAQTAHESGNFTAFSENLNYGAKGLRGIFGKYFPTDAMAKAYERQPQKIANRVYGGRMGNGTEETGDGWLYHGRGLIQLTGKDNYMLASDALREDFIHSPDLILSPRWAAMTAGWYWNKRNLNKEADAKDFIGMTKKINGGVIGLDDRIAHIQHAQEAMTA